VARSSLLDRHVEPEPDILRAVRRALSGEPGVEPSLRAIRAAREGDDVVLEGELPSLAAKKTALARAAAVPGVAGIVDRLRVAPTRRMSDAEIRDALSRALVQEPAFAECAIFERVKERVEGAAELVRASPGAPLGTIESAVEDGVVTLDGDVPSLEHKRLAGVLAWWVPGSRDVVNGLGVVPPEADGDDELTEAVRLALEKDPFVDASQIRVLCLVGGVTLDGVVPSEAERRMAEADAWYVLGVARVANRIRVAPRAPAAR
jgi:osmotically-inducible protein OsmY